MQGATSPPPTPPTGRPGPDDPRNGLSVVIPAFNEAERIGTSLEKVISYSVQHCGRFEILVVDDGSQDATAQVAAAVATGSDTIRVIRNEVNRGKGYSVRRGVLEATQPYRLVTDADLSTPIEELERLAPLARPDTLVIASRGLPESEIEVRQPWYRERMGKTFNLLVRALLVPGVYDTQCGFKLIGETVATTVFPHLELDGWAFDVELIARARRAGMTVHEVPVRWRNDTRTRVQAFGASREMFFDLLRLKWRLR